MENSKGHRFSLQKDLKKPSTKTGSGFEPGSHNPRTSMRTYRLWN
jgi:hypothetical protein